MLKKHSDHGSAKKKIAHPKGARFFFLDFFQDFSVFFDFFRFFPPFFGFWCFFRKKRRSKKTCQKKNMLKKHVKQGCVDKIKRVSVSTGRKKKNKKRTKKQQKRTK